jgi:hypothetical protein
MYAVTLIDLFSALLLVGAFYLVWKERVHFFSLRPLIPAVAFLSLGRLSDVLVEHPSFHLSEYFHQPIGSVELVIAIIGNIADSSGIAFLIYGFIKIIKHEKAKEKHIQELEQLLPLCSQCKKYRTGDGQWLPIEQYLIDSNGQRVTHGICPQCAELYRAHLLEVEPR